MDTANSGNIAGSHPLLTAASTLDVKRDYQAYEILHWGFVALPILAGLDKFALILCDWTKYLSGPFGSVLGPHTTMQVVGVIEVLAGIGTAIKPRWFAPILAFWLWGIIANLLVLGGYYDVALRDFGLSLGALGLWRLSEHFDVRAAKS